MLQELCIGVLKHDSEALARREAHTLQRRSLLFTQSPVLDSIYAETRRQHQQRQRRQLLRRIRHFGGARTLAALGVLVLVLGMFWGHTWQSTFA